MDVMRRYHSSLAYFCFGADLSLRLLRLLPALLGALLIAAAGARAAQNQGPFRLASVSVIGSERYSQAAVVKAAGLQLAATITPDALKQAADRLASLGVFSNVSYRYRTLGDSMTAVITVRDAAGALPCTFDNFVWFTRPQLLQALRANVPLFNGTVPPGGEMLSLITAQLTQMLAARGLKASVQSAPQDSLTGHIVGVDFREVGVPVPVRKVEFTGVEKIAPALLQKAAQPLLNQDYDAPFITEFSQGALTDVYRRLGYLRAQFGSPMPHLLAGDSASNAVAVTLPVTEGEQYRLKQITWSGESAIPYPKLGKLLHAKIGKPVNAVRLNQDVLAMVLLYHPKGYLLADAQAKAQLDDTAKTAAYQIEIRQGDLYRLGTLEVVGVDAATARSIERLSRLRPGDPYNGDYWSELIRKAIPMLPRVDSGWKARTEFAIHRDTKTVDVRLVFSPNLSR